MHNLTISQNLSAFSLPRDKHRIDYQFWYCLKKIHAGTFRPWRCPRFAVHLWGKSRVSVGCLSQTANMKSSYVYFTVIMNTVEQAVNLSVIWDVVVHMWHYCGEIVCIGTLEMRFSLTSTETKTSEWSGYMQRQSFVDNVCYDVVPLCNTSVINWAPSQYKDRLSQVHVWGFLC